MKNNELIGAFIVPTGIGANVGGYAGDASVWARKFAEYSKLIVNPNVVNAGGFSGITPNMFYVEGYSLDEFFKGRLNLLPSKDNKVGVIFDKNIPQDVLNVHINTINAVKTVYGIDVIYDITEEGVDVEFYMDKSGISTGSVNNIEELLPVAKSLQQKGAESIGIVCLFDDSDELNEDYEKGLGVDPVGGVEAIISHYISKNLIVPTAHAPAFVDFSISSEVVNPKSASEYITPTFLPCILIGLSQAPLLEKDGNKTEISIKVSDLDYLVMPYNALGSIPVFEAVKRKIKVFAVKENCTILDVNSENLGLSEVSVVENYQTCLEIIKSMT